jgi:3-keto-disaccharide hydrolase
MFMRILLISIPLLLLPACSDDPIVSARECTNELSAEETAGGWRLLFDGQSLDQWRSYQEPELDDGWASENGCLTRVGWAGDIITREQFGDFELKLEWRISEAGNSGIFIRGDESGGSIHHTGFEMQVLDNAGHSDAKDPSHRAGAFYDMIVPDHDTSQPVGYWNRVHIIARGPEVEFWLNDRRTAAFVQGSPEWQKMYEASKFTDRPAYGSLLKGHIGLQDHWDKVWYRNIRILELD